MPNWNVRGALDHANKLADLGFNVLPAGRGQKAPTIKWTQWQNRSSKSMLPTWFRNGVDSNYWICTGAVSGICVLDCDNTETIRWWDAKLSGRLRAVDQVSTRKGRHFYFRLGELWPGGFPSWSVHREIEILNQDGSGSGKTLRLDFDLRCNGTGVIAAGSVHETGHIYQWVDAKGVETHPPASRTQLIEVPEILTSAASAGLAGGDGTGGEGGGASGTRSILTQLLKTPPTEGGRNDWLTRVCGHYAKEYRTRRDAYEYHVQEAAAKITVALDPAEIDKITQSVWRKEQETPSVVDEPPGDWDPQWEQDDAISEQARAQRVREASADTGWLVSGPDSAIMCVIRQKVDNGGTDGKAEAVTGLAPWSDFDLIARGVVDDPDPEVERAYDLTILRQRAADHRDLLLYAKTLADPRKMAAWLAEQGVSVIPPDNIWPRSGGWNTRLGRYLEAQKPPRFYVANMLGWDDRALGFVCHEGIIRPDGLSDFETVRPAPALRNQAHYRYGYKPGPEGMAEARAVLNETLTFHQTEIAGVFGAWWAASLVKPLIESQTGQFPFMALEAPAESGKTRGMFALLVQLSGNQQGQSVMTAAAMRDAVGAHNSGLVWIDDKEAVEDVHELLRSMTAGGALTKKGEDRTSQVTTRLVAPVVISGEHLGLNDQKALRDRAVVLNPASPVRRRSLHNTGEAQWEDVKRLQARYDNDLTCLAGNIVALALDGAAIEATPEKIAAVRGVMSGRRLADKLAVLRIGARILASMTGDMSWVDVVDNWIDGLNTADLDANSVELKLAPTALRVADFPDRPEIGRYGRPPTPVFIREDEIPDSEQILRGTGPVPTRFRRRVAIHPKNLADWWQQYKRGTSDVVRRTDTADAILAQIKALGEEHVEKIKVDLIGGARRSQQWYYLLSEEKSEALIGRAEGL